MNKDLIVREYLKQQQQVTEQFTADQLIEDNKIHLHRNQMVLREANKFTQEDSIEEFKEKVKHWIKMDMEVKAINSKIKMLDYERKSRKKIMETLSESILRFMTHNEIDELNSSNGIIKSKKRSVKKPINQKDIIQKLREEFNAVNDAEQKIVDIFKNRERTEKTHLCLLQN